MLPQLHLLRLQFNFTVLTAGTLPVYKGDMLRRALLWHLGTMWCRQPHRCREGCEHPRECLLGQLITPPADPTWTQRLQRMMGTVPPPAYVLWDHQDRRREYHPGDSFSVELTLIGDSAIRQQPAFSAALLVAGEEGLGHARIQAQLTQVVALTGASGTPHPLWVNDVWQATALDDVLLSYADGQAHYATCSQPTRHLHLRFVSPTKIKQQGRVLRGPHFPALARAVVRRLRILSQVHGAGEWPHEEWGPLLDLADTVKLEHCETTWIPTQRRSRRGVMPLDGFTGEAWYAAEQDLRPLLPALWLAQWLHIGKNAVWGNGRYRVES